MGLLTLAERLLCLLATPAVVIGCDVSFVEGLRASLAQRRRESAQASIAQPSAAVHVMSEQQLHKDILLASMGMLPHQELGRLKAELHDRGMSQNAWKLYCRHGMKLCCSVRHDSASRRGSVHELILCANLFAAVGHADVPPDSLVQVVGRMCAMQWPGRDDESLHRMTRLIRAAWLAMDAVSEADARVKFAPDRLVDVMGWWLKHWHSCAIPGHAAWPWFESRVRAAREQAYFSRQPCISFGSERRIFEHRVVPLRNFAQLRDAGEQLHNCMRYARPDDELADAYFLVCDEHDHAVAMFHAPASRMRVVIEDILGPANEVVSSYMRTLAMLYLLHEQGCDKPVEANRSAEENDQAPVQQGIASRLGECAA